MRRERILVVDDEPSFREALAHFLTLEDFAVLPLADSYEALQAARQEEVDIVLTDLTMPGLDGIELLKQIRELRPNALGIIMTGYGTIETAVNAMKAGAFDYVTKPFQFDEIKIVIERALEHRRLLTENIFLRRYLREKFKFENIVGDCDRMQEVFALIEKVADSDSTVLIYGESGTGKELVARAIHFNSRRRDKLLVPVNCGAIPEELLESELFGHVRGAFTGANTTRMGRFELGHGGTIFLDEIGEMSPKLQVKLLRVLQTQEFEPLGGVKTIKVDIRVIAATNQDLTKAMAAKRFREDLFYRLNVIPIHLPPLRERRPDMPLLVAHFLRHFNEGKKKAVEGFSPDVLRVFERYGWPGNVRELENLVERLVILKEHGVIELKDLPEKFFEEGRAPGASYIPLPEGGLSMKELFNELERSLILQALERTGGNKNRAARLLGLNRTTLLEKMRKRDVDGFPGRDDPTSADPAW